MRALLFRQQESTITPPQVVSAPTLSGTREVGEDLTCSDGAWNEAVTISREWYADDGLVVGETAATLAQTTALIGPKIHCRVTATSVATGASTEIDTDPVRYTPLDLGALLELFCWIPWEIHPDEVPESAQSLAENLGAVDNDPLENLTDWSDNHTISQSFVSQRGRLSVGASGIGGKDALFFDGDDQYSITGVHLGYFTQIFVVRDISGSILLEHNLADSLNKHYHSASADSRVFRMGASTRANTSAPDDSTGVIIEDRFVSGSLTQYVAGAEIASDTHILPGGDVTGTYTIGGRTSSAFITGYLQGLVLLDGTPTSAQIETLQAWLEYETGLDAITA